MVDTLSYPNEMRGNAVRQLPDFLILVDKVAVDAKNWTTTYRCKKSGEEWLETYESTGHGEIPVVRRKNIKGE